MHLLSYQGNIKISDSITKENIFSDRSLRTNFQIIFQDPFSSLSPRMTISQILSEGLVNLLKVTDKEKVDEMCINILSEVGLDIDISKDILMNFLVGKDKELQLLEL